MHLGVPEEARLDKVVGGTHHEAERRIECVGREQFVQGGAGLFAQGEEGVEGGGHQRPPRRPLGGARDEEPHQGHALRGEVSRPLLERDTGAGLRAADGPGAALLAARAAGRRLCTRIGVRCGEQRREVRRGVGREGGGGARMLREDGDTRGVPAPTFGEAFMHAPFVCMPSYVVFICCTVVAVLVRVSRAGAQLRPARRQREHRMKDEGLHRAG